MRKTLERSLGFWSVFSISVGAMIGSGIFVLPGLAAGKAGPAVILAYFLAGLIALPAALSKAELATAIPATGGTYVYLERSMGSFVGTIGGLGTWFSLSFKSAFALVGLGAYLTLFLSLPTKYVALALCVGVIGINIAGVKKTAKLQMGIILCVFTALAIFISKGFSQLETEFYFPFTTYGWMGVLKATGFVFISYAGVTKIASIVEEVKHPERNIPLGILASLFVMMAVYTLVVCVLIGTVPLKGLKIDLTPIATSAGEMFGQVGKNIWAMVAVLALTSMANAGLLSSSRFPFAMSRDNLLPGLLKSIHAKFRTPFTSILLTGSLMLFLIAFVPVENLAKLASTFKILIFSLVNLSVIIFRESNAEWYRPRFRSPAYPWVQLAGIVIPLLLLLNLGALPMIGVFGIFLFGAVWYLFYVRGRTDRMGALAQTQEHIESLREANNIVDRKDVKKEVLVPFFGGEDEAEIESRIRLSLFFSLPDGVVHPVYFDEAPDQTILAAIRDTDSENFSAKFQRATRQIPPFPPFGKGGDLPIDSIATHDAKLATFRHARELNVKWILMGWQRKSVWNFLIRAHNYWWLHHAPCNVAQFLNKNFREIQKIAVMMEPGPYDALLVHVANRLSVELDAEIFFLHVASEDTSDAELEKVGKYHRQLEELSIRKIESRIIRAKNRLERIVAETKNFDLLIIGAPAEHRLLRIFSMSFEDKVGERAACSVLQVQSPRSYSHEVTEAVPAAISAEEFRLFPFLHTGAVETNVAVSDKESLIKHISETFERNTDLADANILEQAFWKRERIQNTAMGEGVAMPHAVIPEAAHTFFGIFILQDAIDFLSSDRSKVDVCFVTAGPVDQRTIHLKIIGRIAHLIKETNLLARLREAKNSHELVEVVTTLDREG